MATFLIAHGAWSAGWAWKKMRPRLRERGHELWTPTYTGLGERVHLASSDVKLDTHIEDVVKVFEFEDLRDVILVGHSYGGMVATGVADRIPDRISQVIYLDAFVPRNGESLFDLAVPDDRIGLVEACVFRRGRCRRTRAQPILRGEIRAGFRNRLRRSSSPFG